MILQQGIKRTKDPIILVHMSNESGASEAEAQAQLRYLQSVYSQQYELLQNEIATFTMALGSTQKNADLLENRDKISNSTILISGEGGAYIEASIKSIDRAIVYVGAGYLVEKSAEEAMEYLKTNAAKQEETMKRLVADRQRIEKELMDISFKLSAPPRAGVQSA